MTVTSSFTAAEMDPEKTRRGGELLRLYLGYAEMRGERLDRQAGQTPELNPFEIDVRDALQAAGIPLICQYGVSGYRIDFAAKDPDQPGRLVLAIEADGASYHSAKTARDRDRLRQEQLQRLGWRFHRIWSQDWFAHREREIERAVDAYRRALASDGPVAGDDPPSAEPSFPPPNPRGPRPAIPATGRIDDYMDVELAEMAAWVQSDTLLRTRDEHIDAVMTELGFERRGKKIVTRIGQAVDTVRLLKG
jgi:very-short-patch-repair endonuclease